MPAVGAAAVTPEGCARMPDGTYLYMSASTRWAAQVTM
jgi:hypothetical protein